MKQLHWILEIRVLSAYKSKDRSTTLLSLERRGINIPCLPSRLVALNVSHCSLPAKKWMSQIVEPDVMMEESIFSVRNKPEIDTTLPYDTVKEAVSLFGELADPKSLFNHAERRVFNDAELENTLHEFTKLTKLLESMEIANNAALEELATQQQMLKISQLKLQTALASQNAAVNVPSEAMLAEDQKKSDDAKGIENKLPLLQAEDRVMDENLGSVGEIEETEREICASNFELQAVADGRVSYLQLIKAAEVSIHQALEKVLQLLEEKLESKLLVAGSQLECGEELKRDANVLNLSIDNAGDLELERLRKELGNIQLMLSKLLDSRGNIAITTSQENEPVVVHSPAKVDLIQTKAALGQARLRQSASVIQAELQVEELENLKATIKKASYENAVLSGTVESLRIKWNIIKSETESMRGREKVAETTTSALKTELERTKADVSNALAAELSAKEAITSLTANLQEVSFDADRAKVLKKEAMKKAGVANMTAEQAKTANTTLQLRLQAAYKETEASKASEAMATAEIQSLIRQKNAPITVTHLNSPQTIEREQYHSLHQKLQEVEKTALMNISESLELLNTQKATEQVLLNKLKEASIEVEVSKSALQEASQKAQIAEAEKFLLEGELRKMRAEIRRHRQGSDGASVGSSPGPTLNGRSLIPEIPHPKPPMTDHFAQVLQLTFPNPAKLDSQPNDARARATKKLRLFARIRSLFSKKLT